MLRGSVAFLLTVPLCLPLAAHRLDEYLQATLISVTPDHVTLEVNLTPGVEVFERVAAPIDTNHDGQLSAREQDDYARRVMGDVALAVDGRPSELALIESRFPSLEDMRAGVGTIQLKLRAPAAAVTGAGGHQLIFRNRHQNAASVYLMNALVPLGRIEILGQHRDNLQTEIRIDYRQRPVSGGGPGSGSSAWLVAGGLGFAALLGSLLQRRRPPPKT